MPLVGRRPTSVYDLPPRPRPPVVLAKAGFCWTCRTELKTDTQAQLHQCDPVATSKFARLGHRDGRVRL